MDDADHLVETLESPYPERVLKPVRTAIASSNEPTEQVRTIAQLVVELGLEPSTKPELLPEIDHDDVHLVCWIAITPEPIT